MDEEKDNVRVLTRDEKNSYDGLTIDGDGNEAEGGYGYQQESKEERPRFYRVYSSHSPLSGGLSLASVLFGTDWRTRIIRVAALLGIGVMLVLFISFILPVLLAVAGVAIAFWLIQRLFH